MVRHQIGQKPLIHFGIDLQRPVDRTSPGKWPYSENLVSTTDSAPTPRPGLGTTALATAPATETPWHSMRTLNDPTGGSGVWCRYHGIGDRLCSELSSAVGTINNLLGGFSTNPLTMVQGRPPESPQPYMYIADSLLMRKGDRSGNLKPIGLAPPPSAPSALVSDRLYKEIDLMRSVTGWTNAGTATAPTLLSAGVGRPVNTTTPAGNAFVQDTASALTCIAPTAMTNIVLGMVLEVTTANPSPDVVVVEEVHSGSAAISITGILYEAGTTGACSIYLATSNRDIRINSLLLITGVASAGTELVRVSAVLYGDDGTICVRTSTAVARLPTDTVTALPSFTCHMSNAPALGGVIRDNGVQTTIPAATAASTPATLSKVSTLDLSLYSPIVSNADINDFMSLVLRASDQTAVVEIRIMLDCAADSVSAGVFTGTEFTKEYFLKVITGSDLTNLLDYTQTALANRQDQIQLKQLSKSDPNLYAGGPGSGIGPFATTHEGYFKPSTYYPSATVSDAIYGGGFNDPSGLALDYSPGASGTSDPNAPAPSQEPPRSQLRPGPQLCCVRWRLSEMQRVGTSDRGWKDIVGLRIAVVTSGALALDMLDWIMEGGYEPEVSSIDAGYRYRYRGRDSSTGVVSNASPASLGEVRPLRQSVLVSMSQHSDSTVDKLDIERSGGGIDGWHYIATIPNTGLPTYTDRISNGSARAAFESDVSGLLNCQPWPLPQKPQSGSGATITAAGNLIRDTSAPFSTALLRGVPVIANGKLTALRRVRSTSIIEVEDNVGAATSSSWELPRPVYVGQPLPIIFGGGNWDQNRTIALGDPADPSAYYVSRRGNYDATTELLRFEIPGAILQNGCVYNGSPYIASTERLYRIEDAGVDPFGNLLLRAVIVPGSRGLIARWAFCVGDRIYGLDREGIWACDGGTPDVLTDEDLMSLFPHAGTSTQGVAVNGINPPNIALSQEPNLRLSQGADRLRFLYVDSAGARRELEYRMRPGDAPNGWYPHSYTPGVACAYYEEGPGKHTWLMGGADATTAQLYQLTAGQSDAGTAIAWAGYPQFENVGDPRKRKRWGDFTTEIDRDGSTVNVTPQFDNAATALSLIVISTGTGRMIRIHDLNSSGVVAGSGVLATNMAPLFGGSVTTQRPRIYTWEPTWLDRPEVTQLRATDFEDAEPAGPKLVRAIWLTYDALGNTRAVSIYRDGDLVTAAATISGITGASGPRAVRFPIATPFYAHTLLVLPTDAASWMLFDVAYEADPAPPSTTGPEPLTDLGYAGAKWIYGVTVDMDSENAAVSLRVEGDGESGALRTLDSVAMANITHNGRVQRTYTFDPPLISHLVRINRLQSTRLWPTPPTRWIWDPEPELAEHYETQQTTHDLPELFKILRDAQITLRSTSTVTFTIYDGSLGTGSTPLFSTTIPSTVGLRKSVHVPISSWKAKSLIYILDGGGTGFALYRRDTWIRIRGWGRTVAILGGEQASNWSTVTPFGADHRIQGATV